MPKIVQRILTFGKGHHLPRYGACVGGNCGPCCFSCRGFTVKESTLARRAHAGQTFPLFSPSSPHFLHFVCPPIGATLLFENEYFDASFALGIWYICIFTPFHTFLLIPTTSIPF